MTILEAVDHDVYTEVEEVNVDIDFAMLQPTESNLLQAALAIPGIATDSLSSLRISRNPRLLGAHFTPAALAKTWSRELKDLEDRDWSDHDEAEADTNVSSRLETGGPEAARSRRGKTMLLCGIVDELNISTAGTPLLSCFFCQATDSRINKATAVLRGLIYMLVSQQPSLISHVRTKYDEAGKVLFEDVNA
jgi:hypothetical protein